jgi:hypothetical protein
LQPRSSASSVRRRWLRRALARLVAGSRRPSSPVPGFPPRGQTGRSKASRTSGTSAGAFQYGRQPRTHAAVQPVQDNAVDARTGREQPARCWCPDQLAFHRNSLRPSSGSSQSSRGLSVPASGGMTAPANERLRRTGRALNGISVPSTSRTIKGQLARPGITVEPYRRIEPGSGGYKHSSPQMTTVEMRCRWADDAGQGQ